MDFVNFEKYIVTKATIGEYGMKHIVKMRHCFYPLSALEIQKVTEQFKTFPEELKMFYEKIGHGFLHHNKGFINRIIDPESFAVINLQKNPEKINVGIYKGTAENQLIFFESYKYGYLTIDYNTTNGGNIIRYRGEEIANTLYTFLKRYDDNELHLKYCIEDATEVVQKKKVDSGTRLKPDKQETESQIATRPPIKTHHSWILDDDDDTTIT